MNPIRIETTILSDGVLHIANLPCHKGDRVEAIISVQSLSGQDAMQAARQRFLARARESSFQSSGRYPSRDELHERH